MQLIEHIELASSAASITFSNIPQTYTDLYLVLSGRIATASAVTENVILRFNGSTTGYSSRILYGLGSSVGSTSNSSSYLYWAGVMPGTGATANTFGNGALYIPNYAGSNQKSVSSDSVSENNATAATQIIEAGLWANTAAITSISLYAENGQNFVQYSSATLFGILAGSDGTTTVS